MNGPGSTIRLKPAPVGRRQGAAAPSRATRQHPYSWKRCLYLNRLCDLLAAWEAGLGLHGVSVEPNHRRDARQMALRELQCIIDRFGLAGSEGRARSPSIAASPDFV
ncbi:hypothetical protein P8C59_007467 [Phyllachora maydis]|uniref:Uncharacterized protein n=1 Tax=Phyllachora maydis TaxID=1825666 RepID=A0AAD9MDK5_9PEZI|nr:hypothetical protein P8C59_007467 [Phyllachora maydis]